MTDWLQDIIYILAMIITTILITIILHTVKQNNYENITTIFSDYIYKIITIIIIQAINVFVQYCKVKDK